jgi:PAS domain S-box-containing protein
VGVSIWEEDFTSVKAEIDLLAAAGVSDFRRYFAEHPEFVERAIDLVKIRDVNPATLRMFGARDRAELQSLKTVFVRESRTVFVEQLITIAAKRQFLECETVVQTLAGEPLDVAFTVSFPAHDQPYDRVLVTVLDITERKRAGDILRESEERFRLVANNSQILIWLTDGSGKLQFVNRAHRDFFGIGRDPSEFDWAQFIHPEDRQHYMEEFTNALRRRNNFQCRARMRRSDGQMRWIESRGNAISDSAGLRGYIGSSVDITDIYESEQKLREIDQRKDEFLANMSHEIRSPLTAIMGYADILLTKLKDSKDLAYVKTIKESGEYLIEIVNDILDLSKIEAGKLLLHVEPISLHSVLAEVQGLMSARAREKDLTLTLRYGGAVPETIETDRTRLRQILINLVSNAVKFTERGRIEIVVRWVHGKTESAGGTDGPAAAAAVQFEVIDTGIGIAPEHKDILFQPFTQADTTTTRAYEGTGLGLTITRRLVEMLKGSLSFESELGKGSTFRVSIPTGSQQNSARHADGRSANAERSADDLTGQRVLVVDDRKEFCYLIGRYIERAGGRVESVWDGESAIRAAEAAEASDRFHAIIMDIQMPGIDGYETTRRLRARGFRVPILALTAGAMVGDREKCLRAGCDDYLTKPIDREALISRVAYHARRYARAKLRILLVDDSHNACTFLSGVLEKRGHEVRSAYYGESAISLVAEFRPDLFIIDICLPDMNGYDLMRRLKQLDGMGSAKFLGISGFREETRETAPNFDSFMEKPSDIQKLERLLCSIAGSPAAAHAENYPNPRPLRR